MHYSLLVVGEKVEEQLAPYDEGLEVEKLQETCLCIREGKRSTTKQPKPKCAICNGTGIYQYTINPNAMYDWYQFGGRWRGFFKVKPGKPIAVGKTFSKDEESLPANRGNQAKLGDIDWKGMRQDAKQVALEQWNKGHREKNLDYYRIERDETRAHYIEKICRKRTTTFAILKNEVWYFENREKPKQWQKQWNDIVMSLPANTLLSVIDIHTL